jgi:hypothetical protein
MILTTGSNGIDANGEAYDYAFTIELGRVSYSPNEDGTFETVLLISDHPDNRLIEKRDMSHADLQKWFDNPTPEYYEANIKQLPTKE